MEFDELQKIWDSQTQQNVWVIDENALHKRVLIKKEKMSYITDFSEVLSIVVNFGGGSLVLGLTIFKRSENLSMYLMAAWMLATSFYVIASRIRRLKGKNTFDRSVLGELNYAVSTATYQVRFSQLMRWNIVPIGVLSVLSSWDSGKAIWLVPGLLLFFALSYFASGWEHRIYRAKKQELVTLQKKLVNEENGSV